MRNPGWPWIAGAPLAAWLAAGALLSPAPAAAFSVDHSSRHVTIVAEHPRQKGDLRRWAEGNAAALVKILDFRPRPKFEVPLPVEIAVTNAPAFRPVFEWRTDARGRTVQRLVIGDPERIDQEDLLELFCRLILNEFAAGPAAERGEPRGAVTVPDWLSVGVAQNLYPALRTRNGQIVGTLVAQRAVPPFVTLLTWLHLPEGRHNEKAICGLMLQWLLGRSDGAATVKALIKRAAQGAPPTMADVATLMSAGSAAELEQEWQRWIGRQERIVRRGDETPADQLQKLRQQLIVTGDELRYAGCPDIRPPQTPADLLELRTADWMPTLAAFKAEQLTRTALGKDAEYAAVVTKYCDYLDGLKRRMWPYRLRQRLQRAEKALTKLEKTVALRDAYLTRLEQTRRAGPAAAEPSPDEQLLDKSALRDYVDRIEKSYSAPPALE
jgi:hypothetical protein